MRKYVKVNKEVDEEVSRQCNKCGTIYDTNEESFEEWQYQTIRDFVIAFGYGDPSDGVTFKFDICDKCIHEWIDSFKIPAVED